MTSKVTQLHLKLNWVKMPSSNSCLDSGHYLMIRRIFCRPYDRQPFYLSFWLSSVQRSSHCYHLHLLGRSKTSCWRSLCEDFSLPHTCCWRESPAGVLSFHTLFSDEPRSQITSVNTLSLHIISYTQCSGILNVEFTSILKPLLNFKNAFILCYFFQAN